MRRFQTQCNIYFLTLLKSKISAAVLHCSLFAGGFFCAIIAHETWICHKIIKCIWISKLWEEKICKKIVSQKAPHKKIMTKVHVRSRNSWPIKLCSFPLESAIALKNQTGFVVLLNRKQGNSCPIMLFIILSFISAFAKLETYNGGIRKGCEKVFQLTEDLRNLDTFKSDSICSANQNLYISNAFQSSKLLITVYAYSTSWKPF